MAHGGREGGTPIIGFNGTLQREDSKSLIEPMKERALFNSFPALCLTAEIKGSWGSNATEKEVRG